MHEVLTAVDAMSVQELVEIVGRSSGVVLLSPPTENKEAQKTLDTLLSAVNKKQKVSCYIYQRAALPARHVHSTPHAEWLHMCCKLT